MHKKPAGDKALLKIICDSREQNGYTFSDYPDVMATTGTLTTGDYSLAGFADKVAIERKELSDLISCLSHDRDRFIRELERLRGYEAAAVIVEAKYSDIAQGRYRSKMNPDAAIQSIVSIMVNYRMPFFFAGTRSAGEQFAHDFIKHYHRHAVARYKALADP